MPRKQTIFIKIPKIYVRTICKQLRLENPELETVETVILWSVGGMLAGETMNDYMIEESGNTETVLKRLKSDIRYYIKELKACP